MKCNLVLKVICFDRLTGSRSGFPHGFVVNLVLFGLGRRVPRSLAVYVLGIATFGIDLRVPLDVDIPIFYAVGIIACGWLRSRRHLWFATALFITFALINVAIGASPVLAQSPQWIFVVNRSFLALVLLLLAVIVDLWIKSDEAVERQRQRLARQNEELENARSMLEERVNERTYALETASREREEALAALYQAQKMEAVGQLTGGVAHDISNLLTVIGGNASILSSSVPHELRGRLDIIGRAVDHGARLTRQLLAFARRQTLHAETLDIKEHARKVGEMMASSLRENVRVAYAVPDDLWLVEADASQLELALLNIGINARDAMPEGGLLSIEARNVVLAPGEDRQNGLVGEFVALTLADTGSGIAPEALERVFEPFFTTKAAGKGSGLGLSQVYGFTKQSGGAVTIRSECGRGTAVTLHMPRAVNAAQRPSVIPPLGFRKHAGRILYVEDNPAVAAVTEEMLSNLGFEVCRAADAAAALRVLAERERFDLLMTDILMPGEMNGDELAAASQRLAPDLPVLLTSGYGERAAALKGRGSTILRKPYSARTLAEAMARCLTSEQRHRA